MQPYHVALPENLFNRLQTLARSKGQTIEALVQETLEETLEEEPLTSAAPSPRVLIKLPNPDHVLPPYGSPEEGILRQQLAAALSNGPSLSQIVIEDRGER